MAKITVLKPGDRIPGVYSVERVFEYVICDLCNSFSIEIYNGHYRCRKCGNEDVTNKLIEKFSNREQDVGDNLTINKFLYTSVS
jgi:hypothetical protein